MQVREYDKNIPAVLQNLSDDEYYAEIDRADFENYTLALQYNRSVHHQEAPRPPQVEPHEIN